MMLRSITLPMTMLATIVAIALSTMPTLATMAASPPNVLLICVDDLRPELKCYGVDYIHSPNIDRLAAAGVRFNNHQVAAPTCGASRYALLTGRIGSGDNDALFRRAALMRDHSKTASVPVSMPQWFRRAGYTTVSVGKVSHHPGGEGGPDWNDPSELEMPRSWDRHLLRAGGWQHPRGWMHGLAHGEIRGDPGTMAVMQSAIGDDSIYPDGDSIAQACEELKTLADQDRPFFLAVGVLRPHLPWGAPQQYLNRYRDVDLPPIPHPEKPRGRTTWHNSGEMRRYDFDGRSLQDPDFADQLRRHYAACVSYADHSVGRVIDALARTDAAKQTIVVLWGDHGWHLGEHAVWGKHTLFEESLRSPLIICEPGKVSTTDSTDPTDVQNKPAKPVRVVDGLVSTIDVFPTLCELTTVQPPKDLPGESLVGHFANTDATGHPVFAVHRSGDRRKRTVRTKTHRLIVHPDGFAELYDHRRDPAETQNVAAEQTEMTQTLRNMIDEQLPAEALVD